MEMQIPYCICPQIPKAGVLWSKEKSCGKLCERKGVNISEAECCPDHIHMLLEIPPKMSVSGLEGCLKGKGRLMIYEEFGKLKFKYRNREFWCRGYYVDTVGKS